MNSMHNDKAFARLGEITFAFLFAVSAPCFSVDLARPELGPAEFSAMAGGSRSRALVAQHGEMNEVTLDQSGAGQFANISQTGTENLMVVLQAGVANVLNAYQNGV